MSTRWCVLGLLAGCAVSQEPVEADNGDLALPSEQAPPPPTVNITGTCPGDVTIQVTGVTPFSELFVVSGTTTGSTPIPAGPCEDTVLGIGGDVTVRGRPVASNLGTAVINATLGSGPCEALVQAVDGETCAVSNVAEFNDDRFVVGGLTDVYAGTNYFRGHRLFNVDGGVLESFDVFLDLPTGCGLDFYVHERPLGGAWSVLALNSTTAVGGAGYYTSGPLGVPLTPGLEYGVGVGWSCTATYFGALAPSGIWLGRYGLGEFTGTTFDNAYPGPSTSYVPAGDGGEAIAYDHIYVVTP